MAKALAAARLGFRRLFSISAFTPPPAAAPPPKADPSTNLFVSGLSKRTTSEGLREAFSKFGEIIHAKVVTDRVSGYSKGFGFVRYASIEDASEGIKGMDGKFLDGWVIFAEYARPRPPPSQDQPSQPQLNYGSAPPNYSSPISQCTSYTSAATSNYSSQAPSSPPPSSSNYYPQTTQPPLSSSYYAPQTSHPQQSYGGSVPPSNHESAQPQSGYASSYFNHSPQASQPPPNNGSQSGYGSSYFDHSSQTSQPPPSNGPAPALNYGSSPPLNSSTTPSWYSSQTTQPASYMSGPPNYTRPPYGSAPAPNHSSQAPQQTYRYSYPPQASDPASGYAYAPQNSSLKSEDPLSQASARNSEPLEPSSSYSSELRSDYEPGRAANY